MTSRKKKPEQDDIGLAPEEEVEEVEAQTQEAEPEPEPEPEASAKTSIKATKKDWTSMANMHKAQYLKFGDKPPLDESTQGHIKAAKRYEAICLAQIK